MLVVATLVSMRVHIVIFDDTGEVTGNAGTILEKSIGISKGKDAEFSVGTPSYWRKFLVNTSRYTYLVGQSLLELYRLHLSMARFTPDPGGAWDRQVRNTKFC